MMLAIKLFAYQHIDEPGMFLATCHDLCMSCDSLNLSGISSLYSVWQVPTSSCDQSYSYGSCKSACTPQYSWMGSTPCSADPSTLTDDQKKFCECLKACNSCVRSNGGCNADSDESNGDCGECPPDTPDPDPSPSTPDSQYQCSVDDAASSSAADKIPCKSACRKCLNSAHKTSCKCGTETPTYDVSFGSCSKTGDFEFVLKKGTLDVYYSRSYRWYQDNWPSEYDDMTLVKVKFHSPPIAWEGHCDGTTCQVCRYGTRCGTRYVGDGQYVTKGIPQVCEGGQWVPSNGRMLPGLDRGLVTLIVIGAVIFFGAHIAVIITSILWCISRRTRKDTSHSVDPLRQSRLPEMNTVHAASTPNTAFVFQQADPAVASTPAPGNTLCNICGTRIPSNATSCTFCGAAQP